MMDVDHYKRAIQWLRRSVSELENNPTNRMVRLSVLHSFEVTYNISESLLRQAYISLDSEEDAAHISARELTLHASEEGLVLSSPKCWMHYGFVIESMREACMDSADEAFEIPRDLLIQFAKELETFARTLEARRLTIA